jgi:hypothetical protein
LRGGDSFFPLIPFLLHKGATEELSRVAAREEGKNRDKLSGNTTIKDTLSGITGQMRGITLVKNKRMRATYNSCAQSREERPSRKTGLTRALRLEAALYCSADRLRVCGTSLAETLGQTPFKPLETA